MSCEFIQKSLPKIAILKYTSHIQRSRFSVLDKKQSCYIQYLLVFLALAILFEGDLMLSRAEVEGLKENTISKKDAIASEARKWPNARVPYKISKKFGDQLSILRGGTREI